MPLKQLLDLPELLSKVIEKVDDDAARVALKETSKDFGWVTIERRKDFGGVTIERRIDLDAHIENGESMDFLQWLHGRGARIKLRSALRELNSLKLWKEVGCSWEEISDTGVPIAIFARRE